MQLVQSANACGFSPISVEAGFLAGEALIEFEISRQGSKMVERTQEDPTRRETGKEKGRGGRECRGSLHHVLSCRPPCTPLRVP